jgi:ABC-type nickel/cobalt efflux system permease component RcnA
LKTNITSRIAASLLALTGAIAFAQTTAPTSPSDQSQKAPDMGMHHKSGKHHNNHQCCGARDTSGWSMMDRKERDEHRQKVRSMKSYDECKAYADEHHQKMMDRAKEKGRTMPATPRRDACAWLKK